MVTGNTTGARGQTTVSGLKEKVNCSNAPTFVRGTTLSHSMPTPKGNNIERGKVVKSIARLVPVS